MNPPRFLADHDLNEHIVTGVLRREPSIEFTRVRDFGMSAEPDSVVLEYALQNDFLLVSHDVNTMPAAAYERIAKGNSMRGLFMTKQTSPIGPIIESLILIWSATSIEEWDNQVVFLPFE